MSALNRSHMQAQADDGRVTALELFFDLVFVFALTQVTALMAADPTGRGVLRGLLVLAVVWWCWVGYSWLGNLVQADEGIVRLAMFGAMAAMFVIALAIPESFVDAPGGLSGPVVFAFCYLAVRVLHLVLFWAAGRADPGLRRQLLRFTPTMVAGTALLLVASQATGAVQTALWVAVLLADYGGTFAIGAAGWRVPAAGHFAERHGLIVIVALGESIVSIGVGVTALPISWPIVVAAVLGLAVAAAQWWAYFDVVALVAERVLARAQGAPRARLARDSYTFLHLPMVAGIILVALGMKKVLGSVGGEGGHTLVDPLHGVGLYGLFGGTALYLLAHVAFRLRNLHTVNVQRAVVALVLLGLIPVAERLPALAALGLLVAVTVGLIAFEAVRFADVRDRVRHLGDVAVSHLGEHRDARG